MTIAQLHTEAASSLVVLFLLAGRGLDLGLDLVAEVDLVASSSSASSSCRRRNSRSSEVETSSWCAIQASVRPWRTQARIWLSCERSGFAIVRAILANGRLTATRR